jgi:hypothetical protein
MGRELPVVTVRDFCDLVECYAGSTVCYRPQAVIREKPPANA